MYFVTDIDFKNINYISLDFGTNIYLLPEIIYFLHFYITLEFYLYVYLIFFI